MNDNEFEALLNQEKVLDKFSDLPLFGSKKEYLIKGIDTDFELFVDYSGKRIEFVQKQKYHLQETIGMVRLEIDAPPHINPDGTTVGRNHIHIYKENYDLRWAYSLKDFDIFLFKNTQDIIEIFKDFCKYCNIKIEPKYYFQGRI